MINDLKKMFNKFIIMTITKIYRQNIGLV